MENIHQELVTNSNCTYFSRFRAAGCQQFLVNKYSTSPSTTTAADAVAAKESSTALILSETCVKKLNEICTNGDENYLRITVDGGGCSGFQYKFELDNKLNEDDVLIGDAKKVVIDTVSLEYCAGSTLDYQMELIKAGFRIISNPKAEQGCSCGASFALKID